MGILSCLLRFEIQFNAKFYSVEWVEILDIFYDVFRYFSLPFF